MWEGGGECRRRRCDDSRGSVGQQQWQCRKARAAKRSSVRPTPASNAARCSRTIAIGVVCAVWRRHRSGSAQAVCGQLGRMEIGKRPRGKRRDAVEASCRSTAAGEHSRKTRKRGPLLLTATTTVVEGFQPRAGRGVGAARAHSGSFWKHLQCGLRCTGDLQKVLILHVKCVCNCVCSGIFASSKWTTVDGRIK